MAEKEENGMTGFLAIFVGLVVGLLFLRWLWDSPFMSETDGTAMRVFKIMGLFLLVIWILLH